MTSRISYALKAFKSFCETMSTGNPDESFKFALQGVRWVTNYTGKEIKYCKEKEKAAALKPYTHMVRAMSIGFHGETLNVAQQKKAFDQARTALSWISLYTGKDIKHCSEEEKTAALDAYRKLSIGQKDSPESSEVPCNGDIPRPEAEGSDSGWF